MTPHRMLTGVSDEFCNPGCRMVDCLESPRVVTLHAGVFSRIDTHERYEVTIEVDPNIAATHVDADVAGAAARRAHAAISHYEQQFLREEWWS